MKKKWMTRAVALAMTAAFLPTLAFADDWDLSKGSITVSASSGGQNVSQVGGEDKPDSNPVISSGGQQTDNNITIRADSGATANVTVKDAKINTNPAAIKTKGEGNVNLNIEGDNHVTSGSMHAGVEKSNGGKLTIGSESGNGKLEAQGGDYAAGIGGESFSRGTNIEITGGTITATGGVTGAGIGGGHNGSGNNITISGGTVNANGGDYAAGIGGGYGGAGSDLTISGGRVNAQGGISGTGIGGGSYGMGQDITVSGAAEVKVAGGEKDDRFGAGVAIGNGGTSRYDGMEVEPDTSGLYTTGKIEYYEPGTDLSKEDNTPSKTVTGRVEPPKNPDQTSAKASTQEAPAAQPIALYRVVDAQGKDILYKAERKDGVLTLTVTAEDATFTGYLWGLETLTEEGIETVVLTNGTAEASFRLADLLAKGTRTDSCALSLSTGLTLNGETVEL